MMKVPEERRPDTEAERLEPQPGAKRQMPSSAPPNRYLVPALLILLAAAAVLIFWN